MLTTDDILFLSQAYRAQTATAVADARATLGHPDARAIAAAAQAGLASEDRAVRGAMLRVLSYNAVDGTEPAILAGLGDPERRVREVAIRSARPYLTAPTVARRLAVMVVDAEEKHKLRYLALDALCGVVGGAPVGDLPPAALAELAVLAAQPAYRTDVIQRLVRLDLTPELIALLRQLAAVAPPEEVTLIDKALAGFKVINLGQLAAEGKRRHVARTCDPAYGRVFFWVPRTVDAAAPLCVVTLTHLPRAHLQPLLTESRAQGYEFVDRLVRDFDDGANRFDQPGEVLFAAYARGEMVGIGGLNRDPYAADDTVGRVRHLYVMSSHRRHGIGRLLMNRISAAARPHFRRLTLRTFNPEADAFYRALGFTADDVSEHASHQMVIRDA